MQARTDRRQRVSQLMRQRGEELVLAAICFAQRVDGAYPFGDVDAKPVEHGWLAVRVVLGPAAGLHPAPLAGPGMTELELDNVVFALGQRGFDRRRHTCAVLVRQEAEQPVAAV